MEYPVTFKDAMVRRMTGPDPQSARELARETGVHSTTLSHWRRQAGKLVDMPRDKIKKSGGRPNDRRAEDKLQLVLEASLLTDEELGEFLRRNGLHEADLERWKQEALIGLGDRRHEQQRAAENKRLRKLEREILRKDKALAEAAALLVLQKKVQAIWGDGDDDTEPGSDK